MEGNYSHSYATDYEVRGASGLHTFSPYVALQTGVNKAIIIKDFITHIEYHERMELDVFNDICWIEHSAEKIHKVYPYISVEQADKILNELVEEGFLLKLEFSQSDYTWYVLNSTLCDRIMWKEEYTQDDLKDWNLSLTKSIKGFINSKYIYGNYEDEFEIFEPFIRNEKKALDKALQHIESYIKKQNQRWFQKK